MANLGSILGDSSSSDDDSASKKKKKAKNQKKKANAKANKQLQQTTQPSSTTTTTPPATTDPSSDKPADPQTGGLFSHNKDKFGSLGQGGQEALSRDQVALMVRQRRLQVAAEAIKYAQAESIKFQKELNGQSDEHQQMMIKKLEEQTKLAQKKISKRHNLIEKKSARYISQALLRASASNPLVVEEVDRTAPQPFFLIFLKAYMANIKISPEWSQKRRLYQNKSGNEKGNFFIPKFIEDLNARHLVQRDDKTQRQELAAIARARLTKHNIDYQQWDDAFHIHMPRIRFDTLDQTQYEGKSEVERFQHLSPLDPLSAELQRALGMFQTPSATPLSTINIMPPWIPKMQQHGPPPAYPNVYIPGVNAPLPPGADWCPPPQQQPQQPQFYYGPNGQMIPTMPQPQLQQQTIPPGGMYWGQKPVNRSVDPQSGQMVEIPKWAGDLNSQSNFMRNLQTEVLNTYTELSKRERDEAQKLRGENGEGGDGEGGDDGSNNNSTNNHFGQTAGQFSHGFDPNHRVVSMTGAWYPMAKIVPPGKDMNLLLTTVTPFGQIDLETKFNPNFHFSVKGPRTPALFGAIDYIGYDKMVEDQIRLEEEEAKRLHEEERQRVLMGLAQNQQNEQQLQLQQQQSKTEADLAAAKAKADKWRAAQRQTQLDKAVPVHLQHLAGGNGGNVQLMGNQAQSVYAPQNGELFTELDVNTNTLKRKQMEPLRPGDEPMDEVKYDLKRQRGNQ